MTDPSTIGKWIVFLGLGLVALGAIIWLGGKLGLPFGHFPGDMRIERPGLSFRLPLGTSIVVSVLLTLLLNVIIWIFRR
ncbi:MAG: DUF2905 domain-containing protein [Desulfomonile tiedjei]|uniref:DUF2905 domain-containing protein n=1 Tax=Desulfomonile tiedjei TaxID=2358 RepID=A0A9D6V983_9BACT|nr:DUF2905 domain-containing protein [Desulfomonile tiedjei]